VYSKQQKLGRSLGMYCKYSVQYATKAGEEPGNVLSTVYSMQQKLGRSLGMRLIKGHDIFHSYEAGGSSHVTLQD